MDLHKSFFEDNEIKYNALNALLSNSTAKINILYNDCYGGFCLSNEAKQLYKNITNIEFDDTKNIRHSEHLNNLYETLGASAFQNNSLSKIIVKEIPLYMKDYYTIKDKDGKERILLQIDTFKFDMIRFVSKSTLSDSDKVQIINMIIDKNITI